MQVILVYAIAYASAIGLLLGWRLSHYLITRAREHIFSTFTKWMVYTVVTRRFNGSSDVTIIAGSIILLLIIANFVGSALLVRTRDELSLRLAKLGVTNLVILYLGGRSNILLDKVFRLSYTEHQLLHRWVGRVAVIEGLIHAILKISQLRSAISPIDLSLLAVLCTIAVTSIIYVRRRIYELFLRTHSIFSIATLVLLWLHIGVLNTYVLVCVTTAGSIYALQRISWLSQFLYRNIGSGPTSRATILRSTHIGIGDEIVQIKVNIKRPWIVVPGQFVYLSLPRLRTMGLGFWESHPFMIAWVSENEKGQATTIMLLVQCYQGFTRKLQISPKDISALVDGPYGGEASSFVDYDKVLLMSNGIGIAAHLHTARYLLVAHDRQTARVRRLTIVWVLESHDQILTIEEFLCALNDIDQRQILTVFCFYPSQTGDSSTQQVTSSRLKRPRIMSLASRLDMSWFIEREWGAEAGNMLVAVCGSSNFELRARKAITSSSHKIDFRTSPFQPSESQTSKSSEFRYHQGAGNGV